MSIYTTPKQTQDNAASFALFLVTAGKHGYVPVDKNLKRISEGTECVTDREDMQEHVDVHLHNFNTDHTILVDHKGRKFLGPWSDEVKLVEYKNVNGHPGWIFGKADYFAFQHIDHFLMVRKETLLNITNYLRTFKLITDLNYSRLSENLYHTYSRTNWGRVDECVYILTQDIYDNSNPVNRFIWKF